MRGGIGSRGYTILEVMIFLAVSGVMFIIAATFISGKQANAQFQQGVNDLTSQLQQVVSDVSNGYFPAFEDITCATADRGIPTITDAHNTQGSNGGCVFMGKVLQFQPQGADGAIEDTDYDVVGVVGRQFTGDTSSLPPSSFQQAQPILTSKLTEHKTLQWGIQIRNITTTAGGDASTVGAIGFYSSFAGQSGSALTSGAQSVVAIPVLNSHTNQQTFGDNSCGTTNDGTSLCSVFGKSVASGTAATSMDTLAGENSTTTICVSGDKGQYGYVTIGSSQGQRLAVHGQITNNPTAGGCDPA